MPRTFTIAALAASGLFATATASAAAETITVCASGCDYTSIRTAISNANNGDVIQLAAETYIEGGTIEIGTGTDLTIIGEVDSAGDPATIISGNDQRRVMYITGGTLRFQDLQIVSGRETAGPCAAGGGARIEDADTSFVNCWIRDNYAGTTGAFGVVCGGGGGLYALRTGSIRLEGCRFQDNSVDFEADRNDGLRVNIIDCVITGFFGITGDDNVAPIWVLEEAPIAGDLDGDGDYDEDDVRLGMADFGITADSDIDSDGTPDCIDNCPNDPDKTEPGDCGCGNSGAESAMVCAGNVNSPGVGARLRACGSSLVADNAVTLQLSDLPLNQTVLFVNSQETVLVSNPGGSQGDLCIGSLALGRHLNDILDSGATGTASLTLDLASVPTDLGRTEVLAGETRYWQAWYRDVDGAGAPTSNLSSAVGVTFN